MNPLTGRTYSEKYFSIKAKREALPVWRYLDEIGNQLKKSQVIIIEGETGSGKTTQVRSCGNCSRMFSRHGNRALHLTLFRRRSRNTWCMLDSDVRQETAWLLVRSPGELLP